MLKDKNGKPVRVSHSTLECHKTCPRKCWIKKHLGLRNVSTDAQKAGTDVHSYAEAYLKGEPPPAHSEDLDWTGHTTALGHQDPDNVPTEHLPLHPDAEAIFNAGVHLIPEPGTVQVEEWCSVEIIPGVEFVGKVDYYDLTASPPLIADFKTRSNINSDYVPNEIQLAYEDQPARYAYALMHENPPDMVDFVHINLQRKPKFKASYVRAEVDGKPGVPWSFVEKAWARAQEQTRDMVDIWSKALTIDDVPHRAPMACRAYYTDCEYAMMCPDSPQFQRKVEEQYIAALPKKNKSTGGKKKMGFLDRLKANQAANNDAPAAPTTATKQEPEAKPVPTLAPPDRPSTVTEAQVKVAALRKIAGTTEAQVDDLLAKINLPKDKWAQAKGTPAHRLRFMPDEIARMSDETRARVEIEGIDPDDVEILKGGGLRFLKDDPAPAAEAPEAAQPDATPTLCYVGEPWVDCTDPDLTPAVKAVFLAVADGPLDIEGAKEVIKTALDAKRLSAKKLSAVLGECDTLGIKQAGAQLVDTFTREFTTGAVADALSPIHQEESEYAERLDNIVTDALTAPDAPADVVSPTWARYEASPTTTPEVTPVSTTSTETLIVYVDTMPDGPNQPARFDTWAAPHIAAVEEAMGGVPHFVPAYHDGDNKVVARIAADLKANGNPWPNGLYIRSGDYVAETVLKMIMRAPGVVTVRPFR